MMTGKLKLLLTYVFYFLIVLVVVLSYSSLKGNDNSFFAKGNAKKDTTNKNLPVFMSSKGKYVILTFDDGWSSQYRVFQKYGSLKGTLYICSGLIGQEERLSLEELTQMYNKGWDISNHTVHHINLTKVSLEEASEEVKGCSSWLAGNGFTRDETFRHFAYPEGGYNEEVIGVLNELDILTARTTNAGNSIKEFLQLGRSSLHGMTKKNIRDFIMSDQKLLILSFHRIVPDDSPEVSTIDLKESYFQEVIEAIEDSKRKVLTISEWYKMQN